MGVTFAPELALRRLELVDIQIRYNYITVNFNVVMEITLAFHVEVCFIPDVIPSLYLNDAVSRICSCCSVGLGGKRHVEITLKEIRGEENSTVFLDKQTCRRRSPLFCR